MNQADVDALASAVTALSSNGESWAFLYCSADETGEPLLIVEAGRVNPRRMLTLMRTAKSRDFVTGQVLFEKGVPLFQANRPDHPALKGHLAGPLAAHAPALGSAVVVGEGQHLPEEAPPAPAPALATAVPPSGPAPTPTPAAAPPRPVAPPVEQIPESVQRLREAERAVEAQRDPLLGRNMTVVLPRLKAALDALASATDAARSDPWPTTGAATGPDLAALAARAQKLKAGANSFKLVAKSRDVSELLRLDAPAGEVGALLASSDRAAMASGREHLLNALSSLGEANKAALHFTDWRGRLPEDQMSRVDANVAALEGVIVAHYDLLTRLARGV